MISRSGPPDLTRVGYQSGHNTYSCHLCTRTVPAGSDPILVLLSGELVEPSCWLNHVDPLPERAPPESGFGGCAQCRRSTWLYSRGAPTWLVVQTPARICRACGGLP